MYATLASIQVAHIVLNGAAMPKHLPFRDAGENIIKALGTKKAAELFQQCQEAVKANPYPATYESMAEQVKAQRAS